ncbi:hypothetical protein Pcinc_018938 [Petrolisthes cinctipes]|uniref:Secreted protein n=1 Tax=Petrolisthes cinctipes TaxID=88211 RepID=A0AAE1FM67_PETCI|nr:hypothetical protein Pcinc_018938 [Petrolisthes cinctipes]
MCRLALRVFASVILRLRLYFVSSPFNHTLCCLGPSFTDAYKVLPYLLSGPSPVTPPPGPRLRRRPIGYWLWSTFMVPRRASPCLTPLFFYTSQHRMS